jgi:hypothetical protein
MDLADAYSDKGFLTEGGKSKVYGSTTSPESCTAAKTSGTLVKIDTNVPHRIPPSRVELRIR